MRTFEQQVKGFLDNADVLHSSKVLYAKALKQFKKWVVYSGRDVRKLERKDILAYKTHLEKGEKSEATMDIYLMSVRMFFAYLHDCDEYENIAQGIRYKRTRKSYSKEHLTDSECIRLLKSVDRSTELGLRNFAMIYLMMSVGLRCIEVSRLKVGDLHYTSKGHAYLSVQHKREVRKVHDFGIPDEVLRPIQRYLDSREFVRDDEPLFGVSTKSGERAMSPRTIGEVVKAHLVKAEIYSKTKTTHSLRHTAAVRAWTAGKSIYDIKVMLGHSDVKTTQRYLASKEDEIRLSNPAVCPIDLNLLDDE